MKRTVQKIVNQNKRAVYIIGIAGLILLLNIVISNLKSVSTRLRASGGSVELNLNLLNATVEPNANFTVNVAIKPSVNMNIRGYAFPMTFNKNHLEVVNITYDVGRVLSGLGHSTRDIASINSTGIIKSIGEFTTSSGQIIAAGPSQTTLMSITFRAKTFMTTSINIDSSKSQIYMIDPSKEFALTKLSPSSNATLTLLQGQPTSTPTRTPTPPRSTPTRTPTPPTNVPTATVTPTGTQLGCLCNNNACTSQCTFNKRTTLPSGVSYANPIGCNLSSALFNATPDANGKNAWCTRPSRTMGDADGNGVVDRIDYLYYVQAVNGGQIPFTSSVNVNPDFNGDGEVGVSDRAIVVVDLGQN